MIIYEMADNKQALYSVFSFNATHFLRCYYIQIDLLRWLEICQVKVAHPCMLM